MSLELQVYERTLSIGQKKEQEKFVGHILIQDITQIFRFGRNEQTKGFLKAIDQYTFLSEEEGRFSGEGQLYIFIPKGLNISVRTQLRFYLLNFGPREETLERGKPFQVKKGDQYVFRGKQREKEIVIVVVRIY